MKSHIKNSKDKVFSIMSEYGLNGDYQIKKTIIETELYSIYLLSSNDRFNVRDRVLLIEHPPAQRPSAQFLAMELKKELTTTEFIKDIREVVEKHFAQKH